MARPVDYVAVGDIETFAAHQRRQEAMQPVEIGHRKEDIARERLQPAAGVAGSVAQDRLAYAVGNPRLQFLEASILAADALARGEADATLTCLGRGTQVRQEHERVLA